MMKTLQKLFSLEGRRIVVTGASGGLGLAMVETMAALGGTVFALSRTGDVKEGEKALPEGVTAMKMDVSDEFGVADVLERIGTGGGIDVLVNNAGITIKKPAAEITSADMDTVVDTNVKGLFACCKSAYPYLKTSKYTGRIINIASMASHLGFTDIVPYCASKSAVLGVTRALAVEWASDGILVNSVSPGWFPSRMNRQVVDAARQAKILLRMPLHRYGEPEELASVVAFLSSSAASYITGADIPVDGGALTFGY